MGRDEKGEWEEIENGKAWNEKMGRCRENGKTFRENGKAEREYGKGYREWDGLE